MKSEKLACSIIIFFQRNLKHKK